MFKINKISFLTYLLSLRPMKENFQKKVKIFPCRHLLGVKALSINYMARDKVRDELELML